MSETGDLTRTVFIFLLYFLALTFILAIFNGIAGEFGLDNTVSNTGGYEYSSSLQPHADSPRFADAELNGIGRYNVEHDLSADSLVKYGFITGEESCLSYNDPLNVDPNVGFVWEAGISFLWLGGDFWCNGFLDTDYYANSVPFDDGNGVNSQDPVCELALLDTDRSLAERMGCTWVAGDLQDGVTASDGSFVSIWDTLKEMATLQINFGLTNPILQFFLNFLLIGLPFILLGIYAILLIRQAVGFN